MKSRVHLDFLNNGEILFIRKPSILHKFRHIRATFLWEYFKLLTIVRGTIQNFDIKGNIGHPYPDVDSDSNWLRGH